MSVDYFISPYTSTFIRLSHLYQEYNDCCSVITNDEREWGSWGGGWFILGYELGYRGWVSAYSFCCFFSCAFVICSLTFLVPLFRWIEHDDYNFCSFVFFVSGPFNKDSQVHRGCSVCWLCLLCKTSLKVRYVIIILWISLEKGACFDYNHSWECVYPSLYIIRFLGQVYHFSLLICYPYSF